MPGLTNGLASADRHGRDARDPRVGRGRACRAGASGCRPGGRARGRSSCGPCRGGVLGDVVGHAVVDAQQTALVEDVDQHRGDPLRGREHAERGIRRGQHLARLRGRRAGRCRRRGRAPGRGRRGRGGARRAAGPDARRCGTGARPPTRCGRSKRWRARPVPDPAPQPTVVTGARSRGTRIRRSGSGTSGRRGTVSARSIRHGGSSWTSRRKSSVAVAVVPGTLYHHQLVLRRDRPVDAGRRCGSTAPTQELHRRMCGIVGYVGPRQARPLLLAGLEKLEYRGYDSAGISVLNGARIDAVRAVGQPERAARRDRGAPTRPPRPAPRRSAWPSARRPAPASATRAGPRTAVSPRRTLTRTSTTPTGCTSSSTGSSRTTSRSRTGSSTRAPCSPPRPTPR